jgi:hypothetical protein
MKAALWFLMASILAPLIIALLVRWWSWVFQKVLDLE